MNHVVGVELRTWGQRQIVRGFADATVVDDQHGVMVGNAAGQIFFAAVTKRVPTADVDHGRTLAVDFVIHVVAVDLGNGHGVSFRRCARWG